MSASRTLRPRLLRPHLSLRYQALRRAEYTTTHAAPKPASNPTFLRRNRSTLIWTTLSLTLGALAGQFLVHTIAPPELPAPGSREDGILMADLNKRIDEEFKVKIFRGKCLGVAKALKGEEGGWMEIMPDEGRREGGGAQLMRQMEGAKGMGVERMFWDRKEERLIAVVWFGGSLCGWPGVTHGGAIATQIAEKLSLAAALDNVSSSDIRAAATPQRMPGTGNHAKMFAPEETPAEPAQLSLNYVKPTFANNFYVLRVAPAIGLERQPAAVQPWEVQGGHEWEATLETMDGKTCVTARARFAPGSKAQKAEERVVEGARSAYGDFKRWMWPSRQEESQME